MNNNFKSLIIFILKLVPIPQKLLIRVEYLFHLHRLPNLKSPKRFSEWIQWYKLNYRNEQMHRCVDKYEVREYVSSNDCVQYLNVLYQLCDNANEINYSALPRSFVIKTTDGGNGDNIYICRDKSILNYEETNKKVDSWKNKKLSAIAGEWAYSGEYGSRIIVEKYLEDPASDDGSIDDYKFLCYYGKFRYLWVDKNRHTNHQRGFWNEDLIFLDGVSSDCPTFDNPPVLPNNVGEMIEVAEKLSKGFPFARVDLYNIQGRIFFGEITFYPWSGYIQFLPDSFDFDLGQFFSFQE